MGRETDEGQRSSIGLSGSEFPEEQRFLRRSGVSWVLSQLIHTEDHPGDPNLWHCVGLWVL